MTKSCCCEQRAYVATRDINLRKKTTPFAEAMPKSFNVKRSTGDILCAGSLNRDDHECIEGQIHRGGAVRFTREAQSLSRDAISVPPLEQRPRHVVFQTVHQVPRGMDGVEVPRRSVQSVVPGLGHHERRDMVLRMIDHVEKAMVARML